MKRNHMNVVQNEKAYLFGFVELTYHNDAVVLSRQEEP